MRERQYLFGSNCFQAPDRRITPSFFGPEGDVAFGDLDLAIYSKLQIIVRSSWLWEYLFEYIPLGGTSYVLRPMLVRVWLNR